MGKKVDERLQKLLLDAESCGSCLAPPTRADARALAYRCEARGELADVCEPAPGVYARSEYWYGLDAGKKALHIIKGLAGLHGDWVFCRQSAALVWGLPITWSQIGGTHVANVCLKAGPDAGLVRHDIKDVEAVELDGIQVTSLERTAFDCLSHLPFCDALAVADAAARMLELQGPQLSELLSERYKWHPGVRRAAAVASFADPLAESGGESIARAVMLLEGFARPALQVVLPNRFDSRRTFRVDFAWVGNDGLPVLGELDGREKYLDPSMTNGRDAYGVQSDERLRESQLTLHGCRVCRFKYAWVTDRARLVRLLDGFGVPRGPRPELVDGVPVGWSLDAPWRTQAVSGAPSPRRVEPSNLYSEKRPEFAQFSAHGLDGCTRSRAVRPQAVRPEALTRAPRTRRR